MKTKILLIAIVLIILNVSCKVQVYPSIVDGSKSDGTLTATYYYESLTTPIVHWEEAKIKALEKCKAWGYRDFDFFDGISQCVKQDTYGNCVTYQVIYKCQCKN